mmetsp:Transcript_72366/g.215996  ORF Transcript_72366/g.215996 Transcript_72366/m.215996 type:complete len:211 (-) Transcript_72366:566-1198(-)
MHRAASRACWPSRRARSARQRPSSDPPSPRPAFAGSEAAPLGPTSPHGGRTSPAPLGSPGPPRPPRASPEAPGGLRPASPRQHRRRGPACWQRATAPAPQRRPSGDPPRRPSAHAQPRGPPASASPRRRLRPRRPRASVAAADAASARPPQQRCSRGSWRWPSGYSAQCPHTSAGSPPRSGASTLTTDPPQGPRAGSASASPPRGRGRCP